MNPKLQKLLFLLLIFTLALESNAQPYVSMTESSNQWNFSRFTHGPCNDCCQDFSYYFQGDTTIGGLSYQKLYKSAINYCHINFVCDRDSVCSLTNNFVAGLRDDTLMKRVYVYDPLIQADTLLFDFDLKLGDTLRASYFNRNYISNPLVNMVVDSIGFDTIGSVVHRLLFIDSLNSGPAHAYVLIEGIGSENGLLENYIYSIPRDHDLKCFTNSNGIYPSGLSSCNFITSSTENKLNALENWNVYPNPNHGRIEIPSSADFKTVVIYSMSGRKIFEKEFVIGQINEVSIDGPPGVYLLQFQRQNGELINKKVIRQ